MHFIFHGPAEKRQDLRAPLLSRANTLSTSLMCECLVTTDESEHITASPTWEEKVTCVPTSVPDGNAATQTDTGNTDRTDKRINKCCRNPRICEQTTTALLSGSRGKIRFHFRTRLPSACSRDVSALCCLCFSSLDLYLFMDVFFLGAFPYAGSVMSERNSGDSEVMVKALALWSSLCLDQLGEQGINTTPGLGV